MTHVEQSIREAVRKGDFRFPIDSEMMTDNDRKLCLLDPLFWQALGKARAWGDDPKYGVYTEWRIHWHRFIDHLAEGKSAEDFFANL